MAKMTDMALLDAFRREVCEAPDDVLSSLDWYALSIGFFIAKGATPDEALSLGTAARYKHQYWLK